LITAATPHYSRPIQAVRLEALGNITPEQPGETNEFIAWSHPRRGNYMQTPVVVGNLLFACKDNGSLSCFDVRSGLTHYEERLHAGGVGFTASPVSDGHHLYLSSEHGNVHVVPLGTEFSVTATNQMNETVMATPALSKGRRYRKRFRYGTNEAGPQTRGKELTSGGL